MAEEDPPPRTWVFFAASTGSRPDWTGRLEPKMFDFWRHGLAHYEGGGAPYSQQMRRGDTVLLLVGEELLATAVLAGGGDWLFADKEGRRRWPVRVVQPFLERPIPRAEIEAMSGPLVLSQGAVHPVEERAMAVIRDQIAMRASAPPALPLPPEIAWRELGATEELVAALRSRADILPDVPTASQIGWEGAVWPPPAPPPPPFAAEIEGEARQEGLARPARLESESIVSEDRWTREKAAAELIEGLRAPPPTPPGKRSRKAPSPRRNAEPGKAKDAGSVPAPTPPAPTPGGEGPEGDISLVSDAPSENEDRLDRGPYALFLARRLHLIWCRLNGCAPDTRRQARARAQPGDTFILHVDAPWGGGKTTFANFLERVLQPRDEQLAEGHFLYTSLLGQKDRSLAEVFVPDFAREAPDLYREARRPWIIAWYNAWRDQYVQPPWWQIFNTIRHQIRASLWEEAVGPRPAEHKAESWWRDKARRSGALGRWARVGAIAIAYKLGNSKLRTHLLVWLLFLIPLLALALAGKLDGKTLGGVVTLLGFGGVSLAALFNLVSQSLNPDLDFSTEAKQIGVQDPINRFRAAFEKILVLARRPVLLVVDDIDRCEAATVVEVMRGFQTIVRSSRLFVLLLGDRAWIEAAHDQCHKDMDLGSEKEATLGSLFVRKMIQLSFRLPLMSRTAQADYTRYILGPGAGGAKGDAAAAARIVRETVQAIEAPELQAKSLPEREAEIAKIKEKGREALREAVPQAPAEMIDHAAEVKQVAAASADPNRERDISDALAEVFATLPNNPRQMKRVIMSFGLYENVGRIYFQYRRTPVGEAGALKAERWRQLARWVTLATEWPETWRDVAERPELLDLAYRPAPEAEAGLGDDKEAAAVVRRLRCDPMLRPLLGGSACGGAGAPIDSAAVYEFNRIIWEPGFRLAADLLAPAPAESTGPRRRRKNGAGEAAAVTATAS